MENAAGAELLSELRVLGVVGVLRFLLGIQVVQVAEELVEAVDRGQELVAVAQVVLAELAADVAVRLEQLGDRRILRLDPQRRTGQADFGHTSADWRLTHDERGPPRGTALLSV